MKVKKILAATAATLALAASLLLANKGHERSDLLTRNVEALAKNEVTVTMCLGMWTACSAGDAETLGPAVALSAGDK